MGFDHKEIEDMMEIQAIQIGLCHNFDLTTESGLLACKKWMAETHPGNLNVSMDPNPSTDYMDMMMGQMKRKTLVNCMNGLLEKMKANKEETVSFIKEIANLTQS